MKLKNIIAPSILSADFLNLENELKMLHNSRAEFIHIDVMDGVFVPNLTFGPPIIKMMRRMTNKVFDVHLMVSNIEETVDTYIDAGADIITVHVEAVTHLHRLISYIKSKGPKAAVSLNPATPLSMIEEVLTEVDMVLIMSVNPGFGGQSFIDSSLDKITRLRSILDSKGLHHVDIEVDGGVKIDNIKEISDAGANIFVSGSGVFKSSNPLNMISDLLEKIN